jgi:hypothetical protein
MAVDQDIELALGHATIILAHRAEPPTHETIRATAQMVIEGLMPELVPRITELVDLLELRFIRQNDQKSPSEADAEYFRRVGYREAGQLLIANMGLGVSYVNRQPDRQGKYWQLAFLPFDTLVLDVSLVCTDDLLAEIEADAATIIARRGDSFPLAANGPYVILGIS